MRIGSVTDAVYTVHDGVHRRVVTDRSIGAVEVVVDGAGQTNHGEVILHAKVPCTCQRAITADDYKSINLMLLAHLVGFLPTLSSHKLLASGCLQNGTATGDDTTDILGSKLFHFALDEAVVSSIDTLDVETVINTCACHGADGCIHTGGIAARCQNTDSFNLTLNHLFRCFYGLTCGIVFWKSFNTLSISKGSSVSVNSRFLYLPLSSI